MTLKIFHGGGKRAEDLAGELSERIKSLVHEYDGRMALATAVGVLAVVQQELIGETK